ncbi:MAG TPA: aspartate aminotransferase family protein [Bryobacteraceae bacterium]|nr:aspartate aminotransferase family protein [Bryobacteraceae bacterium]
MSFSSNKSAEILARNRRVIPGGIVSTNRATQPELVFLRAAGAYLWDADGKRYIDYHAAFGPYILGHNDPDVNQAVERSLRDGSSLFGTGTTVLEGELAELISNFVPGAERVQLLNTGSEATYQALRTARAATGRDHIIVMQGGYNGWHNDVSCNLATPLSQLGPRISSGEYAYMPISAGVPKAHQDLVHPVNFNDLASVKEVCRRYPVAALITEPILQNIGLVKPLPGYLEGLRQLADDFGFCLIFDEVKTGFRHAIGGYAAICGVKPDLAVFGKALANGYPIAALAGKRELMDYFVHPEASKRVLLAGTYNGHPVPVTAAIATLRKLSADNCAAFRHLDQMGALSQKLLETLFADRRIKVTVVREGSAFCVYFMDHAPVDWHDLASNHDFPLDESMRRSLIDGGVYVFPIATKQCSISLAHTAADIQFTVEQFAAWIEAARPLTASLK